jgi:hypothetical protein
MFLAFIFLFTVSDDGTESRSILLCGGKRDKMMGFILALADFVASNKIVKSGTELVFDNLIVRPHEVKNRLPIFTI